MEEIILSVQNLNKYYKKFHAIKDVSFDVKKGEVVGFIGPNGSGKSTTMKCINSLLIPSSGTITVCGKDIVKEREEALAHQASLIESPGLYLDLSGLDNLKLFAGLRNVSNKRIQEVAELINLGTFINHKAGEYSLGMKQRLALGIVLLSEPEFIILDEPTNGLDPTGVLDLRNIILQLKDEGVSVLFSSHQLGEIEKIADRIISIKNGEIVPFEHKLSSHKNYIITCDQIMDKEFLDEENINGLLSYTINDTELEIVTQQDSTLQDVLKVLFSKNINILDITNEVLSIEDLYLEIFGD